MERASRTDLATAKRELHPTAGVVEPCEGGVLLKGPADELARELAEQFA